MKNNASKAEVNKTYTRLNKVIMRIWRDKGVVRLV